MFIRKFQATGSSSVAQAIFFLSFLILLSVRPSALLAAVVIDSPPIMLLWSANPESDIQGYEVHRGTSFSGPYSKANYGIITGTFWKDWNILAGNTYYYRLRAVDSHGNMSALSAPSEAVVVSTGDFDSDGFTDSFEEEVGTNPFDSASRPIAEILMLNPEQPLLAFGEGVSFSVEGLFRSKSGEMLEFDMTCMVEYGISAPGIISIDGCGEAASQAEGTTDVWARQRLNGAVVAASNQAVVTVDGTPPSVNLFETQPYNGQGLNEDSNGNGRLDAGEDLDGDNVLDRDTGPTPRVPTDTGIVIRASDKALGNNVGIDEQSVRLFVNGATAPVNVSPVGASDMHEVDISWNNPENFAYGQVVIAELSFSDAAGNESYHRHSFRVESEAQRQWALANRPVQTSTILGNGKCEISVTPLPDTVNDEPLRAAKLVFNCDEPVHPRFGPVGELPPVDIATPAGAPISVEPICLFESPITLSVPLPNAPVKDSNGDGVPDTGLDNYLLYQYAGNPSVQWRQTSEANGWIVDGSRADTYATAPPAIKLELKRSSGIQAGVDDMALPPRPDIRANGAKGSLTVSPSTVVSLTLDLAPGNRSGRLSDWWVIADTPDGRLYYRRDRNDWQMRMHPAAQMPLKIISSEEVFRGLPPFGPGDYTIRFGVDSNVDGSPDMNWQDAITVSVSK